MVSTFAGLRPLLAGRAQTPSETSREHTIAAGSDRTVVVAGGKLTTLRRMGEETVDVVAELLRASGLERAVAPCTTRTRPLPGAARSSAGQVLDGQTTDVQARLSCYGGRAAAVLELAKLAASSPDGSIQVCRISGPRCCTPRDSNRRGG